MTEEDFAYLYNRIEKKIESGKENFEVIKPASAPDWI